MENENNNENSNSNVAGTSTGKNNKIFLAMAVGSIVLMAVTALIFFFTALKGAEQTMVPEVRGKELTVALLELQVKELYPRIQLRYSQSSLDRGKILEQNPEAGTIVKAGRRINLVVSQGVVVNRIENFIGRNIDDVRLEMQTIVTPSGSPLLLIKDPLMYDYSPSAAGIILQQKPEPGTDISGQTTMEFVVSQGQGNTLTTMPAFAGLSIASALELLGKTDLVYQFFIRDIRDGEKGETVVHQNPAGGVSIPTGTIAEIVVNTPVQLFDEEVFKLFVFEVPRNPYPLPVRLEALLPSGNRLNLLSINFPGGRFTVPYRLPLESTLILYLMDREIYRETVRD